VEGFESVARRYPQILQGLGGVEHHQIAQRDPFDPGIE
jgi:hypothetical protein